ncbi:IclR family transcriptional regulator C-terminal domain-containing protein, partial [Streptomyces sp. NPDC006476]|uniref:IclR family transcriptional regulator domain-containing protein n=1 Tax=Streptomyces sp. NPDC006476 TaxID=3157175 RepID=UPI0033A756EC
MHGARIAGSEQVEAGQVGPPQESNGELICWKCPVPVTAVGSHMRGSALPINAGASALVLLAWSPDEVRRVLEVAELRRFTAATLTDVDALMERIGRIRRLGHSITRGELDPDVVGIAAPIRDENKQVVAAVSV